MAYANYENINAALTNTIQTGLLAHTFKQAITAELGFAETAEPYDFAGRIGSTITDTRMGLLGVKTSPIAARTNTDITDGLTASSYADEQFVLGIDPYADYMNLQMASDIQVIQSLFLQNAYALGEGARRSMDTLALNALMDGYMGYNTYVSATLGSPGTAVQVNDVRGFFETINSAGTMAPVSSGNPLTVKINGTSYSCTAAVADGTAPATLPFRLKNLTFSGSSSNSSTTPGDSLGNGGGFSGVLTLSTSVSTTNATLGNTVVSVNAPAIFRPNNRANATKLVSGDVLNMATIRSAMNRMRANGVRGNYTCFIDDIAYGSLQSDTEFRQYLQTRDQSPSFREGVYGRVLGVDFVRSNLMQFDSATVSGQVISRPILVSNGALIQAMYTSKVYGNLASTGEGIAKISAPVNNVVHITQPPINNLADVIRQSWASYTGFVCPTDSVTSSTTVPTANNAIRKRAAILEVTQS